MEYLPMGSLDITLEKEEAELKDLITMCYQVASGMSFLHERNILHNDLAARNILVEKRLSNYILKITDFGLSLSFEEKYNYLYGSDESNLKIPVR
jgi:serine/threonine protein kinase